MSVSKDNFLSGQAAFKSDLEHDVAVIDLEIRKSVPPKEPTDFYFIGIDNSILRSKSSGELEEYYLRRGWAVTVSWDEKSGPSKWQLELTSLD